MSNTTKQHSFLSFFTAAAAVLLGLFAAGCTPISRDRTLPPSIRAVHVPMIVNRTAEPGLEERLTVAVQQELLADGRLRLVSEKESDAIVRVTLTDFSTVTTSLDPDDFATGQLYELTANLIIVENIPGRPTIGGTRKVFVTHGLNNDPRSVSYDPEPRQMEVLARNFGRSVMLEVLTGEFADILPSEKAMDDAAGRTPEAGIRLAP